MVVRGPEEARITEAWRYSPGTGVGVVQQDLKLKPPGDWKGADCAHFVSCCIGRPQTWSGYLGGGLDLESDYGSVYGRVGAQSLVDWLKGRGWATVVDCLDAMQPGDVVAYDLRGDERFDHVALYVGGGEVAAHSESKCGTDWRLDYAPGTFHYAFLHIASEIAPGPPTVETLPATGIGPTSAVLNGRVVSDGGFPILRKGFNWGTTADGTGWTGKFVWGDAFTISLSGLKPGTTYYFCAWAANSAGWAPGKVLSFNITTGAPTVETLPASSVTSSSAVLSGKVVSDGGFPVLRKGINWGMTPDGRDWTGKVVLGDAFTIWVSGLKPGTMYYFCAWAANSAGWASGKVLSFNITTGAPTVETLPASSVTSSSAVLSGKVVSDGGFPILRKGFNWGTTADGTGWTGKLVSGDVFAISLSGLKPGTTYYFYAWASNSAGWASGKVLSFNITTGAPTVETLPASSVTSSSAVLSGKVVSDGGFAILRKGFNWGTTPDGTGWTGKLVSGGAFSISLSGLKPGTTYYFYAWASNSAGWVSGNVLSFATLAAPDPGDRPGTARDLGVLGQIPPVSEWVGSADKDDYYRFDVSSTQDVTVRLHGLTGNANMRFIQDVNRNGFVDSGEVLVESSRYGTSEESIIQRLNPGTYYVHLYPSYEDSAYYTLTLTATAAPPDPGDMLLTAHNAGTLSGTWSRDDWVGSADLNDYYKFALPFGRDVTVRLHGLTGDADVRLIRDANGNGIVDMGEELASSSRYGTSEESIIKGLDPGTYYVRVYTWDRSAYYTLSLVAMPRTLALGSEIGPEQNPGAETSALEGNRHGGAPDDITGSFDDTAASDIPSQDAYRSGLGRPLPALLWPVILNVDGNQFLGLTFTYAADAADVRMVLEASQDLKHWVEVESRTDLIGSVDDGTILIRMVENSPISAETVRFLRLKVEATE